MAPKKIDDAIVLAKFARLRRQFPETPLSRLFREALRDAPSIGQSEDSAIRRLRRKYSSEEYIWLQKAQEIDFEERVRRASRIFDGLEAELAEHSKMRNPQLKQFLHGIDALEPLADSPAMAAARQLSENAHQALSALGEMAIFAEIAAPREQA